MPPIPAPPTSSRRPSTGSAERGATRDESSSAPPRSAPRSRATKADVLQREIASMYNMIGVMLRPFGRFYPSLGPIGENFQSLSDDAAEAWIQLAQKDKRVMEMLESITSASTYGSVIGIHLAIFASAIPMGQVFAPSNDNDLVSEIRAQGKQMGLSDEDIEEAVARATGQPMPARDTTAGGPGDTIRTGGTPVPPPPPAPQSKSSIVSPEELGVQNGGEQGTFPTDAAPPNGTGTVVTNP